MESPLCQEYIHMPEEDIRCQNEVIDQSRRGQVSSSIQVSSSGLTTHDLHLRMVISPSFELRFACCRTLWKAHLVNNKFIYLRKILDVRPRC